MQLPRWLSLFTLSLALLVTGCGSSESGDDTNQQASDKSSSQKKAAWTYEGDTGPEHWGDLSDAYVACDGTRQSPVDLTNVSTSEGPSLQTNYASAEAEVTDTGHAIQVNTTGGMLTVGETSYDLLQFHVHTPSEHAVDGGRYPGEIHLVHQAGENQLAVLALFVDEGSGSNPALHDWIDGADTTLTYNPSALLPSSRSYYTYDGSLTTPPCSEIVRWVVFDTPIQASSAQLDTLRAQYEGNARPIQPLNDRTIRHVMGE